MNLMYTNKHICNQLFIYSLPNVTAPMSWHVIYACTLATVGKVRVSQATLGHTLAWYVIFTTSHAKCGNFSTSTGCHSPLPRPSRSSCSGRPRPRPSALACRFLIPFWEIFLSCGGWLGDERLVPVSRGV